MEQALQILAARTRTRSSRRRPRPARPAPPPSPRADRVRAPRRQAPRPPTAEQPAERRRRRAPRCRRHCRHAGRSQHGRGRYGRRRSGRNWCRRSGRHGAAAPRAAVTRAPGVGSGRHRRRNRRLERRFGRRGDRRGVVSRTSSQAEHRVHTPDGRVLQVLERGVADGRPVLVHNGTPNSRLMADARGAIGGAAGHSPDLLRPSRIRRVEPPRRADRGRLRAGRSGDRGRPRIDRLAVWGISGGPT